MPGRHRPAGNRPVQPAMPPSTGRADHRLRAPKKRLPPVQHRRRPLHHVPRTHAPSPRQLPRRLSGKHDATWDRVLPPAVRRDRDPDAVTDACAVAVAVACAVAVADACAVAVADACAVAVADAASVSGADIACTVAVADACAVAVANACAVAVADAAPVSGADIVPNPSPDTKPDARPEPRPHASTDPGADSVADPVADAESNRAPDVDTNCRPDARAVAGPIVGGRNLRGWSDLRRHNVTVLVRVGALHDLRLPTGRG